MDDIAVWTPIVERINMALARWNLGRPTMDGCRLIISMVVGGLTQFLTRVQGMPPTIESLLNKRIHKFMWGDSNSPMVNAAITTMHFNYGGKKLLNLQV